MIGQGVLRWKRSGILAVIFIFSGLILAGCGAATDTLAPAQTTTGAATTSAGATTTSAGAATTTGAATTSANATTTTGAATTSAGAAATTGVATTTTGDTTTTSDTTTTGAATTTTVAVTTTTGATTTTTGSAATTSAAPAVGAVPPTVAPPSGGATISGRVFDTAKKTPLPGAIVVAGYQTIKRATIADSQGRYTFKGIPATKQLVMLSFLAGYTYLFQTIDLTDGQNATLDFGVLVQPDPQLIPTLSNMKIGTDSAKAGDTVTFSMTVKMSASSKVPLSNEIMVMNPALNKSVLLTDSGGGNYTGNFQLPAGTAPGVYAWTFFATDEACREPDKFPVLNLTVS